MQNSLPNGFVSLEDAISLISRHTKENPTVDMVYLMDNAFRVRTNKNFTIRRMERDKSGKAVHIPSVSVTLWRDLEREQLREAIKQKFTELTGRQLNIDELGIKGKSTVVDDQENPQGKLTTTKPSIALGDTIQSGAELSSK